jgi:ribosome-associated protein
MKLEFEITQYDFIELNKLFKILNIVGTGGEANMLITEGEVLLNGVPEFQKRKKVRAGDVIKFQDFEIVVK